MPTTDDFSKILDDLLKENTGKQKSSAFFRKFFRYAHSSEVAELAGTMLALNDRSIPTEKRYGDYYKAFQTTFIDACASFCLDRFSEELARKGYEDAVFRLDGTEEQKEETAVSIVKNEYRLCGCEGETFIPTVFEDKILGYLAIEANRFCFDDFNLHSHPRCSLSCYFADVNCKPLTNKYTFSRDDTGDYVRITEVEMQKEKEEKSDTAKERGKNRAAEREDR